MDIEEKQKHNLDRIAHSQLLDEQIDKYDADELNRDPDDGDDTTLDINSPSTTVFDDEFTEDA